MRIQATGGTSRVSGDKDAAGAAGLGRPPAPARARPPGNRRRRRRRPWPRGPRPTPRPGEPCSTTCPDTEPISGPANPPGPRAPTTMSAAPRTAAGNAGAGLPGPTAPESPGLRNSAHSMSTAFPTTAPAPIRSSAIPPSNSGKGACRPGRPLADVDDHGLVPRARAASPPSAAGKVRLLVVDGHDHRVLVRHRRPFPSSRFHRDPWTGHRVGGSPPTGAGRASRRTWRATGAGRTLGYADGEEPWAGGAGPGGPRSWSA